VLPGLSGLIVAGGYDRSAGVARSAGVSSAGGFLGSGGQRRGGYVKAARSRCHPWEMAVAHRQVASIRSRICRAPRVMRAATCSTR